MRKILILLFAAMLASSAFAQVNWSTMEKASQVDTKTNKKLFFVDFSTSWCGWCKKMDRETFSDPVVSAILNKYYIPVHFDAEGNASFTWNGTKYSNTQHPGQKAQTHPFTRAILGQKFGFPSFALFNKEGGLIQILQGYQNAYDFSMVLWFFCSGDNNKYTFAEYQQIFQEEIKPVMMKKLGL
ncbi:MAG: thioredoxin family protein [Bacteroidales bacterium]|nr:thioredoxin family protein [Bacteroidales bacterium]